MTCWMSGLVLLLMLSGCTRSEKAPAAKLEHPTAKVGFSGMARLGKSAFIVVHDANDDEAGPRFGCIQVNDRGEAKYQPMRWMAAVMPNDLEAICAVPGREQEFLAVESGSKASSGRVFHVAVAQDDAGWHANLKGYIRVPRLVINVEGIVCVKGPGGKLTLIVADRGGTKKNPGGRLYWGALSLEDMTGDDRQLSWPASQQVDLIPLPGREKGWRGCSDLYLDEGNVLWASSGFDGGDKGPFRSWVSRIGAVQPENPARPVLLQKTPEVVFTLEGRKIEGLAAPVVAGTRFSIGTDDEDLGGSWLAVGKRDDARSGENKP